MIRRLPASVTAFESPPVHQWRGGGGGASTTRGVRCGGRRKGRAPGLPPAVPGPPTWSQRSTVPGHLLLLSRGLRGSAPEGPGAVAEPPAAQTLGPPSTAGPGLPSAHPDPAYKPGLWAEARRGAPESKGSTPNPRRLTPLPPTAGLLARTLAAGLVHRAPNSPSPKAPVSEP